MRQLPVSVVVDVATLTTNVPTSTAEDGSSVTEPEHVEVIMEIVESVYGTERVVGSVEEAQQPFVEQFEALMSQVAALPAAEQAAYLAQMQQQADAQLQQQIDDYGH
jgi:phosphoglycerate-specific signal transduction histidine kinase